MADVWAELRAQTSDRVPNAALELAHLRAELAQDAEHLRKRFSRYETLRGILEDGGVVAQYKLEPILDAAHGAWLRTRDVPKRLEITELTEAPIPPEPAA